MILKLPLNQIIKTMVSTIISNLNELIEHETIVCLNNNVRFYPPNQLIKITDIKSFEIIYAKWYSGEDLEEFEKKSTIEYKNITKILQDKYITFESKKIDDHDFISHSIIIKNKKHNLDKLIY